MNGLGSSIVPIMACRGKIGSSVRNGTSPKKIERWHRRWRFRNEARWGHVKEGSGVNCWDSSFTLNGNRTPTAPISTGLGPSYHQNSHCGGKLGVISGTNRSGCWQASLTPTSVEVNSEKVVSEIRSISRRQIGSYVQAADMYSTDDERAR